MNKNTLEIDVSVKIGNYPIETRVELLIFPAHNPARPYVAHAKPLKKSPKGYLHRYTQQLDAAEAKDVTKLADNYATAAGVVLEPVCKSLLKIDPSIFALNSASDPFPVPGLCDALVEKLARPIINQVLVWEFGSGKILALIYHPFKNEYQSPEARFFNITEPDSLKITLDPVVFAKPRSLRDRVPIESKEEWINLYRPDSRFPTKFESVFYVTNAQHVCFSQAALSYFGHVDGSIRILLNGTAIGHLPQGSDENARRSLPFYLLKNGRNELVLQAQKTTENGSTDWGEAYITDLEITFKP